MKKPNNMYEFYRIENEEGYGPFRGAPDLSIYSKVKEFIWPNHPTPITDCGVNLTNPEEIRFKVGCNSPTQLRHWFNKGEYSWMLENGYMCYRYLIDYGNIVKGKFQILYEEKDVLSKEIADLY